MSTAKASKKRNAKKQSSATSIVKPPKVIAHDAKLRKKPQYKSFYLHKRIKHPGPRLPSPLKLGANALRLMSANRRPLIWFTITYGLLSLAFVSGVVSPINIEEVRARLQEQTGQASSLSGNIAILGLMMASAFQASGDVSALYQSIFLITSSLALIWLYRQQQAGSDVGLKDAYYRGMYPLVPFVGVLVIMGLQLIPLAAGNLIYGAVIRGGLAITFIEQLFWFLFFLMFVILSIYLITTSVVALFIVTLPEMTPIAAMREAKQLVMHRRFTVILKIVALLLLVLLAYVVVVFPIIFISAVAAQVLFFLITVLILPFAVAYLFVLYRELLSTTA